MSVTARLTRRRFLAAAAGAGVATSGALSCSWPAAAPRRGYARPAVGFLRQVDAASLLMADELGGYAKQGLAPAFHRSASPADLAERLLAGQLIAAQLPASLPLAHAVGGGPGGDLLTLMVLSHNGAGVTLGREFCRTVPFFDLVALRSALVRRAEGTVGVFAVPALGGTNDLWLRYLLGAAGVPRGKVQIVVASSEKMLADLREERIVGFSAPDPWSALAARQDIGFTFATAQDICKTGPRSALVTTAKAIDGHRGELKGLVRAAVEASVWLDGQSNRARPQLSETLARRQHLDFDVEPIRARLGSVYDLGCRLGERDFEDDILFFHRAGRVNLPRRADGLLHMALLGRFGLTAAPLDPRVVERTIRDDIYREVAREMGVTLPDDMKPFVITLDAVRFDPNAPTEWPRLWPTG